MFTVCVRDHFMIAHSFTGETFGPARNMHGATYVVDAEFRRSRLNDDGVVVDIGKASNLLAKVLGELNYRNLDDDETFRGRNTTTEVLAREIFDRLASRIAAVTPVEEGGGPESLRIVLHESHVAWAAFEGPIGVSSSV